MWQTALDHMLNSLVSTGALCVEMPDGAVRRYGQTGGDLVTVRLHDAATVRAFVLNPELAFGESYMNGTLTIAGDDLQGLMALITQNYFARPTVWWQRHSRPLRKVLRHLSQINTRLLARRNVAHHYDLSGELYDLFLDTDRQYSCAYFRSRDDTIEQAQQQKKDHIARKLLLKPGMRVLDIGCGWGGLAITLARDYGVSVLGVTLSKEQHALATERVQQAGLSDLIVIGLMDYRDVQGTFDRIVSVGMFEHVGLPGYDTYFGAIHDLLAPRGVALVHTIGRSAPPDGTNPWIAKYIFPGGYVPSTSEVISVIEKQGLWLNDVESWRLHYAYTLRHWFDRFSSRADEAIALYDARFVRAWKFYLAACEQTFRHARQGVFQFQLSREIDAVPITRDYLYAAQLDVRTRRAAE